MEYSRLVYFQSSRMPSIEAVVRCLSKHDELRVSIDDKYNMLYKDNEISYSVGETILLDDGAFSMLVGMSREPHVLKEAEALAQELIKRTPVNSAKEQVVAKLATCDARFEIGGVFPDELSDLFLDHEHIFFEAEQSLELLVNGIIFNPDTGEII